MIGGRWIAAAAPLFADKRRQPKADVRALAACRRVVTRTDTMAMNIDGRRWRHRSAARAALGFVNWIDADTFPPCRVCAAHELRRAAGPKNRGAAR